MHDKDTTGRPYAGKLHVRFCGWRTQKCDPSNLAELIPDEFIQKVPEVHEALEELKVMSMDDEFRAAYNAHIKAQNDRRSREANSRAEGKAEGKEEGIAIGEARGRVEGERR